MSELRQNILTGNWVVISPERGRKPSALKTAGPAESEHTLPPYDARCPFCPGNEAVGEINVLHEIGDGKGGWLARVVDNRYKIFDRNETCPTSLTPFERYGPHARAQGCGEHYLVLEHPDHNRVLGQMEPASLRAVFTCYLEMVRRLKDNPNNLVTLVFKNQGRKAGGSQPHAHSQLVGSRVVPAWMRTALHAQERYFDGNGHCALCDILAFERTEQVRVVAEQDGVIAFSPYAAGHPYEVWVVPEHHFSCYHDIDEHTLVALSAMVGQILEWYVHQLGNPDYNFFLYSSPYPLAGVPFYHLYARIVPRLKEMGGFEMGSRIPVNPITPEAAAQTLRKENDHE